MELLRRIIESPRAVAVGAAALAAWGLALGSSLSVDLLPDVDVPIVNVITHLPGASSEDIELLVTRPVEDSLRVAPSVERVDSRSLAGISFVTAQFAWGTRAIEARQIVLAQLGQARSALPERVIPRLDSVGSTLQQVSGWALTGPGDPADLALMARREIASQLTNLPGVERVEVIGGERRAVWITVAPERLSELGISITALTDALNSAVSTRFGGYLESGAEDLVLRGDSRPASTEEVAALPIDLPAGGRVLLGDVATVHDGYAPRRHSVRSNGTPAVGLLVYKQRRASALRVAAELRSAQRRIAQSLPPGVTIDSFYDQGDVLTSIRSGFLFDLCVGALLASLTVFALLGDLRATAAVVLAIPLTLSVTLGVLRLLGESLNAITVSALTLAIGLVVDDAVVVTDSVCARRERAGSQDRGTLDGVRAVLSPDLSGTVTTVVAYAPLLFLGGLAGLFLRPFAATIIAALIASLGVALSVVPSWLVVGTARIGTRRTIALGLRRLAARLDRSLSWSFSHRRLVLLVGLVVTVAATTAPLLRHGEVTLLPPLDEGALLVEYLLPPGVSLRESERVGNALEKLIWALPGVETVFRRVGSPAGGLQIEGVDRGEILARLSPPGADRPAMATLIARLRAAMARIGEVPVLLHQPTQERIDESFSGLPALFGVSLYGPDPATLRTLARSIVPLMESVPGIRSVVDPTRAVRPELSVRIDPLRAAASGVSPRTALDDIEALGWGHVAARILRERSVVPLLLRIRSLEPGRAGLESLPVSTNDGRLVPLSAVAEIQPRSLPAVLRRKNGARVVQLLADIEGNLPAIARNVETKLSTQIHLPPGYTAVVSGQFREIWALATNVAGALLMGGIFVLLVLWLHFRSLHNAMLLAAVSVSALAGAAAALAITGVPIDVGVAAATVTLIGVAVNNGIVLIDFARQRRVRKSAAAALREAAALRLRPILITSLTTIAALVPSALAVGPGQHFFRSFSVAVIGGLCASTPVALMVLPTAILGHLDTASPSGPGIS